MVSCIALASTLLAVPASAQPSPLPSVRSTAPMTFGIDLERAKAAGQVVREVNGMTVLSDSKGKEIVRFSHGATRPGSFNGRIRPNSTVRGDCGESFFDLYRTTGRNYKVQTGFTLYSGRTAWETDWVAVGQETRGASTVADPEWRTPILGQPIVSFRSSWATTFNDHVEEYGTKVTGRVQSGIAWIVGGLFCAAGHPTDSIRI